MSELTQRIQRLMSPEAQEANSREFNVTISILNAIRGDLRDVAGKVDRLRDTVGNLGGDLKEARKDVEYLREGVRTNCTKIEKLEDGQRKTPSKWSGSFKPWSGKQVSSSDESSNIMVLLKYIGIILAGFVVGVGTFAAAWAQLSSSHAEQVVEREARQKPPLVKTTYVPVKASDRRSVFGDEVKKEDIRPPTGQASHDSDE